MPNRLIAAAFSIVVLSSCATDRRFGVSPPALVMTTERVGDTCDVAIAGRRFHAGQEDDLIRFLRTLRKRTISLTWDETTPYRCIGGAIFILQRSGVTFRVPQMPAE